MTVMKKEMELVGVRGHDAKNRGWMETRDWLQEQSKGNRKTKGRPVTANAVFW